MNNIYRLCRAGATTPEGLQIVYLPRICQAFEIELEVEFTYFYEKAMQIKVSDWKPISFVIPLVV